MKVGVVAVAALFLLLIPGQIESGEWDHPSKMAMGELYRYKQRLAYHGLQYEVSVTEEVHAVRYFYKQGENGSRIRCRFW